ncbi:betaine-aldehyde dehydrogenase [Oricola cellulosilytica]|uniref:Betaine aldehyde dehydrogenase n=1 Tax=Oricola cellulosilytica TaxID=1429082 RepID=A0A4R0P7R3_9HYPH|nr:betaine-aldehyde dehydrogenase [Oricola cellulosilytica]TCD11929.1 betaine-aldehyde dehydrogenase [Oricola cellulosilytica]
MRVEVAASHFVAGKPLDDPEGAPIPTLYPATGETIATLHGATDAIIEKAIASAVEAQREWAALAGVERGRVLRRAADIMRERNRELSELETFDTGKPLQETLVADAASGADALEYFGSLADAISGEAKEFGRDFAYTRREPLGVCVGIGAWNYPIQIASWKAAPALACGNAMVFKPSEMTPLSALRLAEILVEAGAPAGLFNVIQGLGDVGGKLISDPRVAKVSLTGSVPTGRKVYAGAAEGLRHVTMELGGKSPLIVFGDADIEDAIGGAMLGNFYSSGQICSNGTRVFVERGIRDKFVERLVERTRAIVIGDPMDEAVQMGPLVSSAQRDKVMGYIETGRTEGATLEIGGNVPNIQGFEDGCFIEPTVFSGVTDDMTIAREEIFGPVMSVLDFDSEDEVIDRANATEFGLAAGVFTRDITRAHRAVTRLQAGTCWINAYNLTPAGMPFGGVKASGFGRENAAAAIDSYSQVKSVYVGLGPVDSPY